MSKTPETTLPQSLLQSQKKAIPKIKDLPNVYEKLKLGISGIDDFLFIDRARKIQCNFGT